MKKTIVWLLLVLFMSFGCTKELEDRMSSLEDRVNALELLCERMSEDISSLRTIISAVQEGDCILSVEPIMENEIVVGYVITFSKSGEIKIYNGKDGYSPLVSIEKDLYGDYYWTLDGEWMLDEEGQRISAEGMTPDFKIIDGSLYMSFDNWNSRTLLGKVEGDSFFKSVDVTDEEVTFILTDGRTFTISKAPPLSIEFDVWDMVAMDVNSSRAIEYTVRSGSQTIVVEVISSSDIKARVRKTGSHTGCIHDGGDCPLGHSEQGVHQFHAVGHCRLCQHKADKALEGHLRALNLGKAAAGLDYAHHKKQHQQSIANGLQRPVDADDHVPDPAAFEVLWGCADQGPDLCEFVVPGLQGGIQIVYDPVSTAQSLHLPYRLYLMLQPLLSHPRPIPGPWVFLRFFLISR